VSPLEAFSVEAQIAFAARLREIESLNFAEGLSHTLQQVEIADIDREFARALPNERLRRLAMMGLRAETFFPCALLLEASPRLLGYYRLLYGISQKEFFRGAYGAFKSMEEMGTITPRARARLGDLCASLCEAGWQLLSNLPDVSVQSIRDLQLLTLGPQLRGGRLNAIGAAATRMVFQRLRMAIADDVIESQSEARIVLRNAAGRVVTVSFSSDPDIAITEALESSVRNVLAVEVKGGTDVSNIHNRLGEAEKSHQKAKQKGFTEFWTIINTAVDARVASEESPTTTAFFNLAQMIDPADAEWDRFRQLLTSRLGVPASP
jgi:hypothetical protein